MVAPSDGMEEAWGNKQPERHKTYLRTASWPWLFSCTSVAASSPCGLWKGKDGISGGWFGWRHRK